MIIEDVIEDLGADVMGRYLLLDSVVSDIADSYMDVEGVELLEKVLSTLSFREQLVLRAYFAEGVTLGELGRLFGVTRGRIQQISYRALRKLKHPSRSRVLRMARY